MKPRVTTTLLPTTLLFVGFLCLGIAVHANALAPADRSARILVQDWANPPLTETMSIMTDLGAAWFVAPAAMLLGLWLAFRGAAYWLKRLVWTIPGCMLSVEIFKLAFQRPRPEAPHLNLHLTTASFPSGHTAGATVLYGFLAVLIYSHVTTKMERMATCCAAALLIGGVAFSRVYLGVHYFTDVAAGLILGLAWLSLSPYLVRSSR